MLPTSFYRRIFTILTDQSQRWLTRDGLKAMFAAARGTELEQGGLRVVIGGIVLAYLAWYVLRDGQVQGDEGEVLAVAVGFFVFAVALALRILTAPHMSVARRFLGMIAMADVLRETDLNEIQREIVNTLGTSAHLLLAQIEDVLDLAKIEAGRVQIEHQPFDLGKLLTSTVKVVLPQARYKDLAVNTEISPQAMRWFSGDSHHLRQVLLNLLANAIKFTERGE